MTALPMILLLAILPAAQGGHRPFHSDCEACAQERKERFERNAARETAEAATGGKAVSLRRIPLNGSPGGFEVLVHMPGKDKGYRCLVDMALPPRVRDKYPIPNPPLE